MIIIPGLVCFRSECVADLSLSLSLSLCPHAPWLFLLTTLNPKPAHNPPFLRSGSFTYFLFGKTNIMGEIFWTLVGGGNTWEHHWEHVIDPFVRVRTHGNIIGNMSFTHVWGWDQMGTSLGTCHWPMCEGENTWEHHWEHVIDSCVRVRTHGN